MARLGDVMWTGRSGRQYRFQTWSFDTRFQPLGAVFLVTRRVVSNDNKTYRRANHEILRAGHTAKLSDPLASAAELELLERSGANCVCVLPAADEAYRQSVLDDLPGASERFRRW
jgi:Tol biopolymer transport system component